METHHIRLTSTELGGLWANYIADSMFICVYKYYLAKVEDDEIKQIIEHALDLAQIGLYAEDGLNLQIKHAWLERPPHAADRDQLMK